MARARNIKPSFFKNETLVELPFEHRLLFVGLWTLADRDGKLEDRPKRIKMEVFPADDVNVEAGLSLLEESGFIERYEAAGVKVIVINNFAKHQSPHHTEKASELPNKDGSFTVKSRKQNGGNPPDSLNPDSLIHKEKHMSGKPDPGRPEPDNSAAKEAIEYLNLKTGARYRAVEANLKLVRARLSEGATLDEIRAVIDNKAREWAGTDSAKYLRPETLFNATKYNQYAGQVGGMRAAEQKPRGLVL